MLKRLLQNRSRLALIVLVAGFVTATVIQMTAIVIKERNHQLVYDESVSYLVATNHAGAYRAAKSGGLNDKWVPASAWKDLMRPGPVFGLRGIAKELSETDYHPPLYFWLLHFWVLVFGVHASSGLWLNWLLALLTGVCLFYLARETLGDPLEAALVSTLWITSTSVVIANLVSRQYPLFALLTVLFVWLAVRACARERRLRWWDYVLFALAAAAGCLTHYHFALVMVGTALFAVARLVRRDRRRLLATAGAAVGGVLLAIALNPWFWNAFRREHAGQAVRATKALVRLRMKDVEPRLSVFFGSTDGALRAVLKPVLPTLRRLGGGVVPTGAILILIVAVVFGAFLAWPRTRRPIARYLKSVDRTGWWMLWFFLWIGGTTVFLYVTGQSPKWGLESRYVSAVWPWLAFVPVLAARLLKRWGPLVLVVFWALLVVPTSWAHMVNNQEAIPGDAAALRQADRVVMDTITRGILLRMVWEVPDGSQLWVGRMDEVLDKPYGPGGWFDPLQSGDVYASYAGEKKLKKQRAQVENMLFLAGFTLLPSKGGVPGVSGTKVDVLGPQGPPIRMPEGSSSPSPQTSPSPSD
jgi:hypothetical protein